MLTSLSYSECKLDSHEVKYTVLTKILTYNETDIQTWCYSSIYSKETIDHYVSL